ncbi:Fanconi anemia group M protein [Megalops cyprinoides]|uniref:Fanconi anemia group M protein n=1 Tax=Megalops cyprinoides TaxID=118141 RepID=UPI0018643971|nr:Fanconi anemia group M protein [Megalops cyprinoides]
MLVAVYEAEKSLQNVSHTEDDANANLNSIKNCPTLTASDTGADPAELPGFDRSSAEVWIYPTNYPVRAYQLKISEKALFENTLVCLPTGLGKTFIASVVMYNFYRWYPSGKIVFMAPTKPLVAQQIEACYKVMGIPQGHMAELTGSTQAQMRRELWRSRRVFFLTPQVMVNDLSRATCPASQVKCVVIDEAHKALGNHAYCQVVRELRSQTEQFRILALSATPGGDTAAVQQVISNLLISHIELRSEESPDIQAHSHQRSLEKAVVPLGDMLSGYQARYLQVLENFTGRLTQLGVLSHRDLRTLTKYQLILARDQFRNNPHPRIMGAQQGMLEGDFALCISLYHGYELLLQMGLRSLFLFVQGIMDGTKEMARARNELQRCKVFMDLYQEMEALFMKPRPREPFIYSHPKLQKLEEVVLQHFQAWTDSTVSSPEGGAKAVSTRVMIFSSFRESVQEIAEMLNRHHPLIRVMTFMGQASAGKGVRGFTQKEQLEVVRRFRDGGFNTLVSTCVGEEGLDIGDVDLIVCFDAQKSPIRLVQRMGRTGRHRRGRIVVILAEGREERTYNQSQINKRSVYKSIVGKTNSFRMFPSSPRMLPEGVHPTLHKMFITCGQFEHRETGRRSSKGRRSAAELQVSLQHPRTPGAHQDSVRKDGLLSPSELSLWESTMQLGVDEPQPLLSSSHFLSITDEAPPLEHTTKIRELSLSEWRHWQNRPFPTHRVEHSDRCRHFIEIMELIDSMRLEEEGSCAYEMELKAYLQKGDVVGYKGGQPPETATAVKRHKAAPINSKGKSSSSPVVSVEDVDKDFVILRGDAPKGHTPVVTPAPQWTLIKEKTPSEKYSGVGQGPGGHQSHQSDKTALDMDFELYDNSVVIRDEIEEPEVQSLVQKEDQDRNSSPDHGAGQPGVLCLSEKCSSDTGYSSQPEERCPELDGMFYLPQWDVGPKLRPLPGTQEKVRVILANIKDLLSRSPPRDFDLDGSLFDPDSRTQLASPEARELGDPFQVNFTLEAEGEEEDFGDYAPSNQNSEDKPQDAFPAWGETPVQMKTMTDKSPHEQVSSMVNSPSWDEVFSDIEDVQDCRRSEASDEQPAPQPGPAGDRLSIHTPSPQLGSAGLDESMDLFGDDEAFLQVSIPDVPSDRTRTQPPEEPAEGREHAGDGASTELEVEGPQNPRLRSPGSPSRPAENTDCFDCSQELFSVNFDLGYSIEDSDEEDSGPGERKQEMVHHAADPAHGSTEHSTPAPPQQSFQSPGRSVGPHHGCVSTPLANQTGRREGPPLISRVASLLSPIVTRIQGSSPLPPDSTISTTCSPMGGSRRMVTHHGAVPESLTPRVHAGKINQVSTKRSLLPTRGSLNGAKLLDPPLTGLGSSDSEEETVIRRKQKQGQANPLSSPVAQMCSDVDSPVQVARRRAAAISTSEESEGERMSDQDFQEDSFRRPKAPRPHSCHAPQGRAKPVGRRARQFLDEEAELSEEGGSVSSDEAEEEEQNHSLDGFVVDASQLSQGLNDSEMQGVYMKSVRSPAMSSKYKLVYKPRHDVEIFSQVPEQDETYGEDSFVVHGSEVEELSSSEEEEEEGGGAGGVELIPEESFVGGRRMYPTRRRVQLRQARAGAGQRNPHHQASRKTKRSRIVRPQDSSEEEEEGKRKRGNSEEPPRVGRPAQVPGEALFKPPQGVPPASHGHRSPEGVSLKERCRQRLNLQASVSEAQVWAPSSTQSWQKQREGQSGVGQGAGGGAPPMCVLADERSVAGGAGEVLSCLRRLPGVTTWVCPLAVCSFAVSNRMAVERRAQTEAASSLGCERLTDRIAGLLGRFDRVCLILEEESTRPGCEGPSRRIQSSPHCDSMRSTLALAGVKVLFSRGPEETAGHLAELARLERSKGQAITVPTEVRAHQRQALNVYLSLPSVSYVTALNMCHAFQTVGHLLRSSVEALVDGARVSHSRAEEILRHLSEVHCPTAPPTDKKHSF